MIPATWNSDGSLKHWDLDSYLEHFGVKGQKWGVRRGRGASSGGSMHPASADAARAHATMETIRKHGVAAVSNGDLNHLVNRQRLVSQHAALTPDHVSAGKKIAQGLLKESGTIAKQEARQFAAQNAHAGLTFLARKGLHLALRAAIAG